MSAASAAKAPPRKTAARPAPTKAVAAASTTPPVSDYERRRDGLVGLGSLGQGLCLLTGQYADAAAIGRYWQPVASELATVAGQYESIAKPVDILIQVGPFAALLTAVMPLAMQIAANHRMVDASRLYGQGVVSPEVLEAQMKAEMAQMQAEAMMAQKRAMMEAQAAQAQFERMMAEESGELAGAAA
jgi:hypothetical protein